MSPAPPPRPPRRDEPSKGPPPQDPRRVGKHFEVRKGRAPSGANEALPPEEADEPPPPNVVALPRSITQEQEEESLKKRLNREEVLDINKRHAAVKMVGAASAPDPVRRRGSGIWMLILIVVLAALAFLADKYHILDKLKN